MHACNDDCVGPVDGRQADHGRDRGFDLISLQFGFTETRSNGSIALRRLRRIRIHVHEEQAAYLLPRPAARLTGAI